MVGAQRSGATEQIRFLSLAGLNECHPCLHDELNYPPLRQAGGMPTILKQLSPQTLLPALAARFNICIPNAITITGIGDRPEWSIIFNAPERQAESCREPFRMSYLRGPARHW